MSLYAEKTTVSVERSMAEIRKTLSSYKATAFATADSNNKSMVMFEMRNRRIRIVIDIPVYMKWLNRKNYIASQKEVEQECRRLWRCLLILIKAKLESVESGISTFEEAFMPYIVLPNGQTVGDAMVPQISAAYENNQMPPLLGYGK
jgi:hypothetical protein